MLVRQGDTADTGTRPDKDIRITKLIARKPPLDPLPLRIAEVL
jgi:hypothetical protein